MKPAEYACSLTDADIVLGCGGKAAQLSRMLAMGLPVPTGFVVTDLAFQAFLDHNSLRQTAEKISSLLGHDSLPKLNALAGELRQRILAGELPNGVREALNQLGTRFTPPKTLIVRSSALGEDGAMASFAGQLDSILNVEVAELAPALLACWASYWSERVLFYQHARGVRLAGMGVIVQEQVDPLFAGVLFTANLDLASGSADDLLVEYHPGHGEALVQGRVDPGRVVIARDSSRVRHLAVPEEDRGSPGDDFFLELSQAALAVETACGVPQDVEWAQDAERGLWLVQSRPITRGHKRPACEPSPATGPTSEPLVATEARGHKRPSCEPPPATEPTSKPLVATEARGHKRLACEPSPATGLTSEPLVATEDLILWSNANVNENYPEPISPLLYSIASTSYYHYFRNLGLVFGVAPARIAAMEQPLRHIIGVHGARMYYHLTNIHAVLRAAPFGEQLADYFSAFTGAEAPAGTGERRGVIPPVTASTGGMTPRRSPVSAGWRSLFEAALIALKAVRVFRTLPRRVAEFESTVDQFAERTTPDRLARADLRGLLDAFRGFLDIRFHRWTNAGLADAAAMISYGGLKHLLRREFPQADQSALHNTLLKGLTDVISSAPLIELWRLSRIIRNDPEVAACFARFDNVALLDALHAGQIPAFGNDLLEYLNRWGFRRSGELMLTVPGFLEEPGPLLDILRAYALVDGESPADRLNRQRMDRNTETQRVVEILSHRRMFRWLPWPSLAGLVRRLLHGCQIAITLRERARTRQALLYAALSRHRAGHRPATRHTRRFRARR